MRLAYLTTQYPKISHTFIRRELRELESRGHSVLRVAIRASADALADPLDRAELQRTIHVLAQPVHLLLLGIFCTVATHPLAFAASLGMALRMGWRSDGGLLRYMAYLTEAAYLRRLFQQHQIEHVHVHFGTNPAAVARLVRRLGGPGYSLTIHGPDEFDLPVPLRLREKAEGARFLVAISDFCGAQLRRWLPLEHWSKIHVIRCGVADDFLDAVRPIPRGCTKLVCVGRLCPQKGQLLLLDSIAELHAQGYPVQLVLAGGGEMRDALERRIRALGLEDDVEITGGISEAQVREHILSARALVLPSFAEGLPLVLMEAFALGRPVVSTYIAGIPELVRPGQNGWLAPAGSVTQLTAALTEVLDSSTERLQEMASRGRQLVLENHLLTTEVAKLETLLRECCVASAPRAWPEVRKQPRRPVAHPVCEEEAAP